MEADEATRDDLEAIMQKGDFLSNLELQYGVY